jgi:uncharacterized protein
MIRRLYESDRGALETLLRESPHFNVYMLGNLASLGIIHEISEFWGDFSSAAESAVHPAPNAEPRQTGTLRGVINRYMTGWSVYGRQDADWEGLAQVLANYPQVAERLQDNPGGVSSFIPYLRNYASERSEEEELMTLTAARFRPVAPQAGIHVRCARHADLDELTDFYAVAETMRRSRKAVERPLNDGYFWVAEADGRIRATALTNAVGGEYAMIGGVYTHPAWRGQGLSQAVCSALCAALLANGLTPSLYWIAPEAGHVYRKLGFETVGVWRSVWLTPAP